MSVVAGDTSLHQFKFYVIEDDPDHQMIAQMTLKSAGVDQVTIFATGEDAISFFENRDPESPETPRVILIDLMLPAIGGLEILQRLRHDARWGESKMIVLSCSTSDEDRAKSREYGADRFLSKPLRMENVLEIISSFG
jgi:DNA-binding response OmpR family regulator